MAATNIWFPFYPADYLRDTMHLRTEHHGAYLLLLLCFYSANGEMPDDDETFASITKADLAHWKGKLRPVISKFFQISNGVWTHKRVKAERLRSLEISEKRVAAGKLGGRPQKQNESKTKANAFQEESKTKANGIANAKQNETHTQSHTQLQSPAPPQTPSQEQSSSSGKPDKMELMTKARTALFWLNEKAGKHFRETDSNLKIIAARISEVGGDLEGVKVMIDRQCSRWLNDPTMTEYLRPATLFGKTKFEDYFDQRTFPVLKPTNGNTSHHFPTARDKGAI